jgi:hypothetical protein
MQSLYGDVTSKPELTSKEIEDPQTNIEVKRYIILQSRTTAHFYLRVGLLVYRTDWSCIRIAHFYTAWFNVESIIWHVSVDVAIVIKHITETGLRMIFDSLNFNLFVLSIAYQVLIVWRMFSRCALTEDWWPRHHWWDYWDNVVYRRRFLFA